jgi:hypothetical protein
MTEEESVIQEKTDLLTKARYIKEAADQLSAVRLQPHTQENAGVLLLGIRSAGKSTIVNYLSRIPLFLWIAKEGEVRKDRKQGCIYLVDESNPQAATIGYKKTAETKYIRPYDCKPDDTSKPSFPVLDIPGVPVSDEDDKNRDVINLLTLERAIQQVQNIKLSVIVDYGQFEVERGSSLKKLASLLGMLISPDVLQRAQYNKVLDQANPNILFIVNKFPEVLKYDRHTHLVQQIEHTRESMQAQLKRKTDSASRASLENAIQFCLIMEQTPESHLIIVNPVDEGESRSLIFKAINTTVAISSNQFTFNTIPQLVTFRKTLQTRYIEP